MTDQTALHPTLTRRRLLKLVGGTTMAWLLTACAPPATPPPPTAASAAAPATAAPPPPTAAPTKAAAPTAGAPRRGGILRYTPLDTIVQMDPALALSVADALACDMIYDTLTRPDPADTSNSRPMLAESWETDAAKTTWTFKLRQGVKFHHGTPFTAKDVEYTFKRILDPKLGALAFPFMSVVDRIEVVGDYIIRFYLKKPLAFFPQRLFEVGMWIAPHDRSDKELSESPSGTGPFKWGENVPGQSTTFPRNDAYWDTGKPYLDAVRFVYIGEPAARMAALSSDTTDIVGELEPTNIAVVEGNSALKVLQRPYGADAFFIMHTTEKPFDDVRVRKAVKLTIDRPGLVQAVLQGRGVVMNDQPVPPESPDWVNLPTPQRDIAKAKELLSAAGYANGLDLTLYVMPGGPGYVEAATAMQEMMKPAGINLKVERLTADIYWTEAYMQKPFFVSYWIPTDLDYVFNLGFYSSSPYNESGWQSPELDAQIDALASESDLGKRKAILTKIQTLISEEGAVLIPYMAQQFIGMRREVQGIEPFNYRVFFHTAWLSQG